jgi:ribosomal protein S18 acetylase RimI-like enzyme
MSTLPTLHTLEASEWAQYREVRLRSLTESPNAFGSTLSVEQERGEEAWAARLSSAAISGQDCPLVAEQDGKVIGLVWAKVDSSDGSAVNVFQMWVAPDCRGRGVGSMLLREVVAWARSRNARSVQLGVACGDTSAARLYAREGFKTFGTTEPLRPGSELLAQSMQLMLNEAAAYHSIERPASGLRPPAAAHVNR